MLLSFLFPIQTLMNVLMAQMVVLRFVQTHLEATTALVIWAINKQATTMDVMVCPQLTRKFL